MPIFIHPEIAFPILLLDASIDWIGPIGMSGAIMVLGLLVRGSLGAGIGWLLRGRTVSWLVSVVVSVILAFGLGYGSAYLMFLSEQARESGENVVPTAREITWSDWEEYADPRGLFDFRFAPGMAVTPASEPFVHLADVAIGYSTTEASYLQPNYSQDSWFVVSSQLVDEAACYASINGDQLKFSDDRMVGSTTFKVASATSAGAGNSYEQTLYRTHLNGICFEIATTLHYASDYTDIDEAAMNASQSEARTMLDEMVSTFRFNLDNSQGL